MAAKKPTPIVSDPGLQAPPTAPTLPALPPELSSLLSSSTTVRYGGGGGGGGGGYLQGNDADLDAEIQRLDPRYQSEIDDIQAEIAGQQGKLVDLDPDTAALLDQELAAERLRSQSAYADRQADLLTRLFGGGMHQSTVAGDVGSRLLRDQGLVEAEIESAAAGRRLDLRGDLTQQQLESLALRGQLQGTQLDAALQEVGLTADQLQGNMDRRAGLRSSRIGADAQVTSAGIQAGATISAAQSSAEASKFGAILDYYGDTQRLAEDSRQFNEGLSFDKSKWGDEKGFRGRELDLRKLESDRDYDLGGRQISVQRYGITSENKRFAQGLAEDTRRYDQDFGEDRRRYDQDFGEDRRRYDQDYELQKLQMERDEKYRWKQLKYARRKAIVSSVAGGFAAGFSDANLKNNVREIDRAEERLAELRGVRWDWNDGSGRQAGVIAQDVQGVLPEAVFRQGEHLAVDYAGVVGLLVEAVNALRDRVKELEAQRGEAA